MSNFSDSLVYNSLTPTINLRVITTNGFNPLPLNHIKPHLFGMKERIICAAIHNPDEKDIAGKPLIYCGLRHANILWQSKLVSRNPHHQGFLTSKGRFVDRKEGLKIALENNQVIDISQIRGDNLYSEDLY